MRTKEGERPRCSVSVNGREERGGRCYSTACSQAKIARQKEPGPPSSPKLSGTKEEGSGLFGKGGSRNQDWNYLPAKNDLGREASDPDLALSGGGGEGHPYPVEDKKTRGKVFAI